MIEYNLEFLITDPKQNETLDKRAAEFKKKKVSFCVGPVMTSINLLHRLTKILKLREFGRLSNRLVAVVDTNNSSHTSVIDSLIHISNR